MWNYRIVRKKHTWKEPGTQREIVSYSYGIHEAYYDKAGKVGAITEDPVEPFGENIEELRHSWVGMAEAFGKPVLDCDNIPEPGYVDEDEGEYIEVGDIPREPMTQEKSAELDAELEKERVESEQQHNQKFVGIPTLKTLLEKIHEDYTLSYEKWFVQEVKDGLKEVENGKISTPEEVAARFTQIKTDSESEE